MQFGKRLLKSHQRRHPVLNKTTNWYSRIGASDIHTPNIQQLVELSRIGYAS